MNNLITNKFLQYLISRNVSALTLKNYRSDLSHFSSWIINKIKAIGSSCEDLQEALPFITKATAGEYKGYLVQTGIPAKTINRRLSTLRTLSKFFLEEDLLGFDFTSGIENITSTPLAFPVDKSAKEFEAYLATERISPVTIKNYTADINQFARWTKNLGKKGMKDITSKDIKRYLVLEFSDAPQATIDRKTSSLKKFFNWAKEKQIIEVNPIDGFLKDTAYLKPLARSLDELTTKKLERKVFGIEPSYKTIQDRIIARFAEKPKLQKVVYKLFYTRPKWYQAYHSLAITRYFHFAILVVFAASLGFGIYQQFFSKAKVQLAYPETPVTPNRYLSFQGRLTNQYNTPVTDSSTIKFELYDDETLTGPTHLLWDSSDCEVVPDQDGIFNVLLGTTTGEDFSCPSATAIGADVFSENAGVWLQMTTETETMDPRVQIATVAYALNADTVQGFPITATVSATKSSIVVMDKDGQVVLGELGPKLKSVAGNFAIEGQTLTLQTASTSNGDINISPNGTGSVNITSSAQSDDTLYVTNAQTTTGAVIHGYYGGVATDVNLLRLGAGASETDKFVVKSNGDTAIASGADYHIGTIGLSDNSTSSSGSTLIGLFNDSMTYISGNTTVQSAIKQLDTAIGTVSGSAGGWTDDGDIVRLTTSANRVGIGTTSVNAATKLGVLGAMAIGSQSYSDVAVPTNGLIVEGTVGIGVTASSNAKVEVLQSNNTTYGLYASNTGGSTGIYGFSSYLGAGTGVLGEGPTIGVSGSGTGSGTGVSGSSESGIGVYAAGSTFDFYGNTSGAKNYFAGNTGIGTTSPQSKLDVEGGAAIGATYSGTYTSPANGLIVQGNVGIGVTSPTQALHISGNMRLTGLLYDVNNEAGNNGQILSKTTTGVDWVDIGTIGISGTGTINYIPRWASSSSLTNSSIYDDGGNVGIGTTVPGYTLDVATTSSARGINVSNVQPTDSNIYGVYVDINNTGGSGSASSYGGYFHSNITGTGYDNIGVFGKAEGNAGGDYLIGVLGESSDIGVEGRGARGVYGYGTDYGVSAWGTNYDFYAYNSNSKSYFAGNVGIGATVPTQKLSVSGNIGVSTGVVMGANSESISIGASDDTIQVTRGGSTYTVCDSSGNCGSGTGATKWNGIQNPDGAQSLTMAAYNSSWTWGTLDTGTALNFNVAALTTGVGIGVTGGGTTALTSGNLVRVTGPTGAAALSGAAGGVVNITASGAYTSANNAGLLNLNAGTAAGVVQAITVNSLTTGTGLVITSSGASQTSAKYIDLTQTGVTTGFTGSFINMTSSSTTGAANFIQLTANSSTVGVGEKISMTALTTGTGLSITGGSAMAAGGELVDLQMGAATAGNALTIVNSGAYTGTGLINITANALTTGTAINVPHTTSVIANGGSLLRLSSTSVDTSTTTGVLLDLSSSASTAGTQLLQTYSALATGIGESIVTNALSSGTALSITSSSTAVTSAGLVSAVATGSPASSWTGSLGTFEYTTSTDTDIDGSALKAGITGAGAGSGIALNITSAQTAGDAFVFRANDDGTYTDSTPFIINVSGNVGIGTTSPTTLLQLGHAGTLAGTLSLAGGTSGIVTIDTLATAGTWSLTLPPDDGDSGEVLTTDGSGNTTWEAPSATVKWNAIQNPDGAQSLTMSTYTTTWNWATGTSTNNLFNLTTDASSNGTGSLLNIQTGTSSTVQPLRIRAGATEALFVSSGGNVGIGTTVPVQKVDIVGSIIKLTNTTDGDAYSIYGNVTDGSQRVQIGWDGTNNLASIHTNSYSLPLSLDASTISLQSRVTGNVGIGTTVVTNGRLEVWSGNSSVPGLTLRGAGAAQGWLKFGTTSGDYYSIKAGADYTGMLFYTNGSEAMRINTVGNIGMGTTTPGTKLGIVGGVGIGTTDSFANAAIAANNLAVQGNVGIGITNPAAKLEVRNESGTSSLILSSDATYQTTITNYYSSAHPFNLSTVRGSILDLTTASSKHTLAIGNTTDSNFQNITFSTNGAESVRIRDGYLGIGTTSPNASLQVGQGATGHSLGANDTYLTGKLEVDQAAFFDTGIYGGTGAGSLALSFSGSNSLFYGNVGMGTTSPQTRLGIVGGVGIGTSDSFANAAIAASDLAIQGNVGIGKTNPVGALEINKTYNSASTVYGIYEYLTNTGGGIPVAASITSRTMNTSAGYTTGMDVGTWVTASTVSSSGGQTTAVGARNYFSATSPYTASASPVSAFYATAPYITGTGTVSITNMQGLHVDNMGSSSVANAYGIYIAAQSGATTSNYGIYSAGGTNYFEGNMGIGITNPSAKLHVYTSTSGADMAIFRNNGDAYDLTITTIASGGGINLKTGSGDALHLSTNSGSPSLSINTSGNVGIGASIPTTKLSVNGGVGIGATNSGGFAVAAIPNYNLAVEGNVGIGTTNPISKLHVSFGHLQLDNQFGIYMTGYSSGALDTDAIRLYTTDSSDRLFVRASNTDNVVQFASYGLYLPQYTTYSLYSGGGIYVGHGGSAYSSYFNGNVGIYDSTPSYPLDVTGNIRSTGTVYANANGAAYLCGGDDACLYDVNVANTVGIQGGTTTVGSLKLGSNGGTISGNGGNIGIGTTSPLSYLDVVGSSTEQAVMFRNANSGTGADSGLGILANSETNNQIFAGAIYSGGVWTSKTSTQNAISFISGNMKFLTGSTADGNTVSWSERVAILNNGNMGVGSSSPTAMLDVEGTLQADMTDTTSGYVICSADHDGADQTLQSCDGTGDIAEYYQGNGALQPGDITSGSGSNSEYLVPSSADYDANAIGVISTMPVIKFGTKSGGDILLALNGRVPVKVAIKDLSKPIKNNDKITASSLPGIGMKSERPGRVVAQALDNTSGWNESVCPQVSSIENISWPEDEDGTNGDKPCYRLPDGTYVGKIMAFLNVSWYDPDVYMANTGDLNIAKVSDGNYTAEGENGTISRIGVFAQAAIANVSAGAIKTKELVVETSAQISGTLTTGIVNATSITTEGFMAVQAEVDTLLVNVGLVSPKVQTAMISPLVNEGNINIQIGNRSDGSEGKLTIENQNGEEVASIDTTGNATFSGELAAKDVTAENTSTNTLTAQKIYADQIVAKDGKIFDLSATNITGVTREEIEAMLQEAEADQELLQTATNWTVETASQAAELANIGTANIENLFVTQSAAMNSLSLTTSLSLGSDMVLSSTTLDGLAVNSLDTLSAPLEIQSLAMAPVEIMAGRIKIDTEGNVSISGNLYVAGKIEAEGLVLSAQNTEEENGSLLTLKNTEGSDIGSVSASGSAEFSQLASRKLVIAGADSATASANTQGEIETNASAGHALLAAQANEITIRSSSVTDKTLVYVTPTTSTQNNVLFVKAKGDGYFKVGFIDALDQDVEFNWWVIDVGQ